MRFLVLLIVFLSGCAHDPWRPRDTALEIAFQTTLVADAITTSRIKDHPNLIEGSYLTQRVIGENPSDRATLHYFLTMGISHYLISRALSHKWRPWYQGGTLIYEIDAVRNNCDNGLC